MEQQLVILKQWQLTSKCMHDADIFLDKLYVSIDGKHRTRYKVSVYDDKKQFVQIIFKTYRRARQFYKLAKADVKHTTIIVNV